MSRLKEGEVDDNCPSFDMRSRRLLSMQIGIARWSARYTDRVTAALKVDRDLRARWQNLRGKAASLPLSFGTHPSADTHHFPPAPNHTPGRRISINPLYQAQTFCC